MPPSSYRRHLHPMVFYLIMFIFMFFIILQRLSVWYQNTLYICILEGWARNAGQFLQKNLYIYVSTFIGICKLFEMFLKTNPFKLFNNYMHYFTLQCVRYGAAGSEGTCRSFVRFKDSLQKKIHKIKVSQHVENSCKNFHVIRGLTMHV